MALTNDTDILNAILTALGSGGGASGISGTATGGSTTTLVKSTAHWSTNQFAGCYIKITPAGGGEPYFAEISGNTETTVSFVAAISRAAAANDTFEVYNPPNTLGALSKDTDSVSVYPKASTAGGNLLKYSTLSANTTNVAIAQNGPSSMYAITMSNSHSSAQYVRLYNAAIAGNINPASTTGLALRYIVPANGSREITLPYGYFFDTGIGIAITGAISDTDTTPAVANTVAVNIFSA